MIFSDIFASKPKEKLFAWMIAVKKLASIDNKNKLTLLYQKPKTL
jgi:hypothetical protein